MLRIFGENSCAHGVFGAVDQPEQADVTARWAVCVNAGRAGVWRVVEALSVGVRRLGRDRGGAPVIVAVPVRTSRDA